MNRADFLAVLAATSTAPAVNPAAVTADIEIKRDGDELLVPFTVTIAVRNATANNVALDFPTADIYRIDVRRGDAIVWSTATGHKPLLIARRVEIMPGLTRLASQIVDGTTDDRHAYAPGSYIVHVAMLGTTLATSIDRSIDFRPPLTIAQARATPSGTAVTIAGVPSSEVGVFALHDETGSIRLSRPLGLRPAGRYIVRGYLDAVGDDVDFAVGRFAPAFENLGQPRAAPAAGA